MAENWYDENGLPPLNSIWTGKNSGYTYVVQITYVWKEDKRFQFTTMKGSDPRVSPGNNYTYNRRDWDTLGWVPQGIASQEPLIRFLTGSTLPFSWLHPELDFSTFTFKGRI